MENNDKESLISSTYGTLWHIYQQSQIARRDRDYLKLRDLLLQSQKEVKRLEEQLGSSSPERVKTMLEFVERYCHTTTDND